jgi:hypothetical protein
MAQRAVGLQALCSYGSNDTDDNGDSGVSPSPMDIDMHKKSTLSMSSVRLMTMAIPVSFLVRAMLTCIKN